MPSVQPPTLVEATEGTTTFLVPKTEHVRGPKKKEGGPFYNPAMRIARDVSVLMLRAETERRGAPLRACDAMAATGARGLRFANEVPGTKVQLNDANPDSISLAQQNAKRLQLRTVDFRVGRLETHLGPERYDWVDIDPFGTPAPFIDVSILGVEDDGIVAVTGTDAATLSGVYADTCWRRYNARPRRGECMPELAARILVGAVVRAAGRRDRAATPLLAYSTQHYVRAYVRVHGGATQADEAAAQIGYAVFGPGLERRVQKDPGAPKATAGPLWTGALVDPATARDLAKRAKEPWLSPEAVKLVSRLVEEAGAAPLYYEIDDFTRETKANAPRLDRWIESLKKSGIDAVRTHFSDRAIKTTAPPSQLLDLLRPSP